MRDSVARPEETELKALILLLAYPLAEIAGFVLVGGWIGVLPTLGLVILSAVLGVVLLRRQALAAGQDLRGSLQGIRGPVDALADGALIALGAMLLIVPGFLSDLAAIPLLIPPLRCWRACRGVLRRVDARLARLPRRASRSSTAHSTKLILMRRQSLRATLHQAGRAIEAAAMT
jgi:UPF0716 protein FxsA